MSEQVFGFCENKCKKEVPSLENMNQRFASITPVDNLESESADLPLSARQGSILKKDIDELNSKTDSKQNNLGFGHIVTTYTGDAVDVELTDGVFLFIGFQGGSLAMTMLFLVSVTGYEETSYISDIVTAKIYNPTLSINPSTKILSITPNVAGFSYKIIKLF